MYRTKTIFQRKKLLEKCKAKKPQKVTDLFKPPTLSKVSGYIFNIYHVRRSVGRLNLKISFRLHIDKHGQQIFLIKTSFYKTMSCLFSSNHNGNYTIYYICTLHTIHMYVINIFNALFYKKY